MQFDPITFLETILPLIDHEDEFVQTHSQAAINTIFGTNTEFWLRRMINYHPQTEQKQRARRALRNINQDYIHNSPQALYIQCFGEFQVTHYTQIITDWDPTRKCGARRTQGLLAFLVHKGREGATEQDLIHALWGKEHTKTTNINRVRSNLSNILERNRQHGCSSYLKYESGILQLQPHTYNTDVQLFLNLKAKGDHAIDSDKPDEACTYYKQAYQFYIGNYMEVTFKAYNWHQEQRFALQEQFLSIVEYLARYHFEQQQYQDCIDYCYSGLYKDFTVEELMVSLLMSLYEQKRDLEATRALIRYMEAQKLTTATSEYEEDFVIQTYWHLWPNLK